MISKLPEGNTDKKDIPAIIIQGYVSTRPNPFGAGMPIRLVFIWDLSDLFYSTGHLQHNQIFMQKIHTNSYKFRTSIRARN